MKSFSLQQVDQYFIISLVLYWKTKDLQLFITYISDAFLSSISKTVRED